MAKKEKKVVAPKKEKVVKPKVSSAHFVTFRVRAVIPTQSFGNIQPEIEVDAQTFEEAAAFALPHIEKMYKHYAEVKPAFLGKIEVTEKVVAPTAPTPAAQPQTVPAAPVAQDTPAPVATAASVPMDAKAEKAVANAKSAIANAATEEAAVIIQDQIENSVKIPAEAKTELINLCLKKRNSLK